MILFNKMNSRNRPPFPNPVKTACFLFSVFIHTVFLIWILHQDVSIKIIEFGGKPSYAAPVIPEKLLAGPTLPSPGPIPPSVVITLLKADL